jgi:hypothetical protein
MRRFLGSNAVLLLLVTVLPCPGKLVKEPSYSSDKPLYALVMLDEDATKVVTIVFDESQGTGKGYDTIYADLNLNGDLADDQPVKGVLSEAKYSVDWKFPVLSLSVPYNERGTGIESSWEFAIAHYKYGSGEQSRLSFPVVVTMRLKDRSGVWEYTWSDILYPVAKPGVAVATPLVGRPILILQAKADMKKPGNVGLAANLIFDGPRIYCKRDGTPVAGSVLIADEQGKTILSEEVSSDQLSFG